MLLSFCSDTHQSHSVATQNKNKIVQIWPSDFDAWKRLSSGVIGINLVPETDSFGWSSLAHKKLVASFALCGGRGCEAGSSSFSGFQLSCADSGTGKVDDCGKDATDEEVEEAAEGNGGTARVAITHHNQLIQNMNSHKIQLRTNNSTECHSSC